MTSYASGPDSVRLALPAEAPAIARIQRRSWEQRLAPEVAAALGEVDLEAMIVAWHRAIVRPPAARFRVLVALASSATLTGATGATDATDATGGREPGGEHVGGPGWSGNDGRVVGFAATVPSDDSDAEPSDGEIEEFAIDPPAQRLGHGSRLLHACVDTLRADGFSRARWWVTSADDPLRAFATAAGWAPDGAFRELGMDDDKHPQVRLKQLRLHSAIAP